MEALSKQRRPSFTLSHVGLWAPAHRKNDTPRRIRALWECAENRHRNLPAPMRKTCTEILLQREPKMGYDHVTFSIGKPYQECPLLPRQRRRMGSVQASSYGGRRFCFPSAFVENTGFFGFVSVRFFQAQSNFVFQSLLKETTRPRSTADHRTQQPTGRFASPNQQRENRGQPAPKSKSSGSFLSSIRQ